MEDVVLKAVAITVLCAIGLPLEAFGWMLTIPLLHDLVPQVDYAAPSYGQCFSFAAFTTVAWFPLLMIKGLASE